MSHDDEWDGDSSPAEEEKDLTRIAAAVMIETGNVDATERQLRKAHDLTAEEAQDVSAEALMLVIGNAPREIRQSFEATVSWHRWNAMYQMASKKKQPENMMAAQRAMDALIARVH